MTLDRIMLSTRTQIVVTIVIVAIWVYLAPSWWSLISAAVLLVSVAIYFPLKEYRTLRGNTPLPNRRAKWFVIILFAHSIVGLTVALYRYRAV